MSEFYHGLTVSIGNGITHWSKAKKTKEDLLKHLKRYVRRNCHLIIYKEKTRNRSGYSISKGLIFDEHISNFK